LGGLVIGPCGVPNVEGFPKRVVDCCSRAGVADVSSKSSIDSAGGLVFSAPSPSRLLNDEPNENAPAFDGFPNSGSLSAADSSSRLKVDPRLKPAFGRPKGDLDSSMVCVVPKADCVLGSPNVDCVGFPKGLSVAAGFPKGLTVGCDEITDPNPPLVAKLLKPPPAAVAPVLKLD
jgi:hypothetical protein